MQVRWDRERAQVKGTRGSAARQSAQRQRCDKSSCRPYAAVFTAEWFIHLPLFNALLGFPIQLLGLVLTPYLAIRYFVGAGLNLSVVGVEMVEA